MEEFRGLDRGIRYGNRKVYTHSLFSQVPRSWPFLPFAVQDTVANMFCFKENRHQNIGAWYKQNMVISLRTKISTTNGFP